MFHFIATYTFVPAFTRIQSYIFEYREQNPSDNSRINNYRTIPQYKLKRPHITLDKRSLCEIRNIDLPRKQRFNHNSIDFFTLWNDCFDLGAFSRQMQEEFAFFAKTNGIAISCLVWRHRDMLFNNIDESCAFDLDENFSDVDSDDLDDFINDDDEDDESDFDTEQIHDGF